MNQKTIVRDTALSGSGVRPTRILFIIVLALFAGEATIMMLLSRLPQMAAPARAIADATILALVLLPVLYLNMYRPMAKVVSKQAEVIACVKTLKGIVPICMHCHKMRIGQDDWQNLETFLEVHTQAQLSHGLCRECEHEHYADDPLPIN